MDPQRLIPGDPTLCQNIADYLKAKGVFDAFRHECLADVDTKSSYQNLSQRVDGFASKFLSGITWHSDLNKNETRNKLRRNIEESSISEIGGDHVVEQVINPKIYTMLIPKIREVSYCYINEQTAGMLNKKSETFVPSEKPSEKPETSDSKTKTSISDPIADILSFSYSKSKPTISTSTHNKIESPQQKHSDVLKVERKKEDKIVSIPEKSHADIPKLEKKKDEKPVFEKSHIDLPKTDKKKEEKPVTVTDKSNTDIIKVEKKKVEKLINVTEKNNTDDTKVEKKKEEKSINIIEKSNVEVAKVEKRKEDKLITLTEKIHADLSKVEKKKEEKQIPIADKNTLEISGENTTSSIFTETKTQIDKDKEKIKKEEPEISQEVPVKVIKEEIKLEKEKPEDVKMQISEVVSPTEENKATVSTAIKSTLSKKDFLKNKQRLKSSNAQKSSSSSSSDVRKPKKELSDKSSEKFSKSKPTKYLKETSSSPKSASSTKSTFKEEKVGESSKTKSSDSNSNKVSEPPGKPFSKSSGAVKDSNSKNKGHREKTDKSKMSKSSDKYDQNINYDSSNSEKVTKSHYSSSYDSSQGSDQERSSSSSSKNERQKYFSKHVKKEKSGENSDKSGKFPSDPKKVNDTDESLSKKFKNEKLLKHEKLKDARSIEAAKISSRSNSFGSTSSISSSSNASKDNLISNSEELSESSMKKKKNNMKEKDSCHESNKIFSPPPPPPPPSSSSLLCGSSSSAEIDNTSIDDTQSSSPSEASSNEENSDDSSSDLESESKDIISDTLNESTLNSSSDNINSFYDIFLYSSSSSEFDGFENSPEKIEKELFQKHQSDVSVSSVHTSDLSSYDDELSDDDFSYVSESGGKKRLTLKEAQELLKNKAALLEENKNSPTENKSDSINSQCTQKSSLESSDEEPVPSEPTRSLRRKRKLNPRYASSEYTSIFNSRKNTFITKQSPSVKSNSCNSSPNAELKHSEKESLLEKSPSLKKPSLDDKINEVPQKKVKQFHEKRKNCFLNSESSEKDLNDISSISSSDEMNSIMEKDMFQENNKPADISDNDSLKVHLKLKLQNDSNLNINSYSIKRKLTVAENPPNKRSCSRSSVDSSSSEFAPNENKPFNNEKQNIIDDKILRDSNMKAPDLTDGIKKDLFCKQRTNNNGALLGQKDIFPKNSHSKTINNSEKKTNESDTSKEVNAL